MKRISNLYENIINIDNLKLADKKARKGKSKQYGVKQHLKNEEENILFLHEQLKFAQYEKNSINSGADARSGTAIASQKG